MIRAGGKVGISIRSFGSKWSKVSTKSYCLPIRRVFRARGAPGSQSRKSQQRGACGTRYPPALLSARAAQSTRARASISAGGGGAVCGLGAGGGSGRSSWADSGRLLKVLGQLEANGENLPFMCEKRSPRDAVTILSAFP